MRKFIPGSLLIISGFILFLLSCTAGACFEETESYLKASLYNNTTKKLTAPDTLTLYGLNQDSIIYNKKTGVQVALIPLNSSKESCTFVLEINKITDTIEFRYSSYPHLISKECGYTYYHYLDSLPNFTIHGIKRIEFGSKTVTNLNVENLRIYY
jgi:hypothetical protein